MGMHILDLNVMPSFGCACLGLERAVRFGACRCWIRTWCQVLGSAGTKWIRNRAEDARWLENIKCANIFICRLQSAVFINIHVKEERFCFESDLFKRLLLTSRTRNGVGKKQSAFLNIPTDRAGDLSSLPTVTVCQRCTGGRKWLN